MSSRKTTAQVSEAARSKAPATRGKVVRLRQAEVCLAPGAHFAKLVARIADGRYRALVSGRNYLEVGVAPEVDLELANACLAESEVVLVGAVGADVLVFGALRTKSRRPEDLVVDAQRTLVLRAGKARLELSANGKVKLSGTSVTVDAPREVRIASAHVEIP
jgi:hypothetical protein